MAIFTVDFANSKHIAQTTATCTLTVTGTARPIYVYVQPGTIKM